MDEGWKCVQPAVLLWQPGGCGYERPSYMTRTEKDEPKFTPEEENEIMTKEINESDGFDIDFSSFRCVFNYHPAILDSDEFVDESETTGDLLKRLAQKSLHDFNQENGTGFEFIKILKANYHFASLIMFLITFQVKDPYDDKIKLFQTRVVHANDIMTLYIFCRPKPNQRVECIGTVKKVAENDVEK